MAPEVITASGNDKYDGYKADIWSCGVALFAMLYGEVGVSAGRSSLWERLMCVWGGGDGGLRRGEHTFDKEEGRAFAAAIVVQSCPWGCVSTGSCF